KGGIVAVENLVLGGEWHPKGWNGIEECRFIPHPHLSLEELQGLNPDSERGRACQLWVFGSISPSMPWDRVRVEHGGDDDARLTWQPRPSD
ncbi:unnamed protein product, partial [Durusdinium trenchii]